MALGPAGGLGQCAPHCVDLAQGAVFGVEGRMVRVLAPRYPSHSFPALRSQIDHTIRTQSLVDTMHELAHVRDTFASVHDRIRDRAHEMVSRGAALDPATAAYALRSAADRTRSSSR